MSQTLLTPSMIAKEALMAFKNKLGFTKGIDRQYSGEFAIKGAKIGNTITIRKPPRFTVNSGPTINIENVVEESTSLTLSNQKHVDFQFSSQDLTLTVDRFKERYLDQAVLALANQVDLDGLKTAAQNVYNAVGTPGTTPNTALLFLQAQQKLNELACPQDNNRSFFINPACQANMVDALKGLFQSSTQIAEQYESGMMGVALGGKWYLAQNIDNSTTGPQGGTPLVNGGGQTGSSLSTKGWTSAAASRLSVGDVFTIANVNKVNPITKQSTGVLQQFVVTAAFSSDGSGNGSVSISPAITTSGPTQTVDVSPIDGAALTILGAASTLTANNILCHKNAFTLGSADLEMPGGVDFASVASDDESGLSLRIVRAYDINNDMFPCRIDVLYGWAALRPEWACRITG
jgi:hypothetical protein